MHLDSIKHFNIRNTFTKYQNTNYKGKTTFCCACDRKMWLVVENRSIFCSKSKHYIARCAQSRNVNKKVQFEEFLICEKELESCPK